MLTSRPHNWHRKGISLLAGLLFILPTLGNAIAFCDLRDPTHQIYALYPSATSYRSLVDTVDKSVKDDVSEQLPFTLHNRELGKHTLYVALKADQAIGLVHVRSEASDWGLIEIVWSLDLDLRVRDFRFQRCREAGCDDLQTDAFKQLLRGKNLAELQKLVDAQGASLDNHSQSVPGANSTLARSVLRSALKTLLVTQLVWGDMVAEIG